MSKEGSPELTKSWVFVAQNETSGVQEVTENEPHGDSDTDSFSVISESGCSYKTDEEEFTLSPAEEAQECEETVGKPEFVENPPEIVENPPETVENRGVEKLLYFATSAVCAVILIGLSVAVQQYLNNSSDVDNFEQDFVFSHVHSIKSDEKKYRPRRKIQFTLEDIEKLAKFHDNERRDKIGGRDNDPRAEGNLKSNFKLLNKNKSPVRCNKENCDAKIRNDEDNEEEKRPHETYSKKIKELKIKEDYLREKEKFLIEKEHDLLKKEIKLNKEKENCENNRHDKKNDDEDNMKKKYRPNKENNERIYPKKYKEIKPNQKKQKLSDEVHKKRNISGQWYINLHEARNSMRQKKRSNYKRNKAHWYFQWMVDRARLRVK